MEEDFYAVIKLMSGEEIFSKVSPCEEDERTLLILEDPIKIEKIKIKETEIPVVKINPWVELSNESIFIIDLKNVIMITETNDNELISMHTRFVRSKYKKPGKTKITQRMGYVSSIDEARKKLEILYRANRI